MESEIFKSGSLLAAESCGRASFDVAIYLHTCCCPLGAPVNLWMFQNIAKHIGDDKLQKLINFSLKYMSELELPVKRGTFIEFRFLVAYTA